MTKKLLKKFSPHRFPKNPKDIINLTIENGYTILKQYIGNCEDGKQYPVSESKERARLVEAPVKRPEKSSRSIGLKEE